MGEGRPYFEGIERYVPPQGGERDAATEQKAHEVAQAGRR